jgi:hypothetical protein
MDSDHFWGNFFEMVEDMHRHILAGETVVCEDSTTRRVIGFASLLHRWEMPLTTAMMSRQHCNGSLKHKEMVEMIKTPMSRAELCQLETIRRLNELR